MSSQFISTIAFLTTREDATLPAALKSAIFSSEGDIDTTLLQRVAPHEADQDWSDWNYCWEGYGSVHTDTPEHLELEVSTNYYAPRDWLLAVSDAFPTVRMALRGSDDDSHFTEHYVLEGGVCLRDRVEHKRSVANMNLWVAIQPMGFEGTWMERELDTDHCGNDHAPARRKCHQAVRAVLQDETASPLLLAHMRALPLTPRQSEMLLAHPNYNRDVDTDEDWWLGKSIFPAIGSMAP